MLLNFDAGVDAVALLDEVLQNITLVLTLKKCHSTSDELPEHLSN
jgi:hypothetical protein